MILWYSEVQTGWMAWLIWQAFPSSYYISNQCCTALLSSHPGNYVQEGTFAYIQLGCYGLQFNVFGMEIQIDSQLGLARSVHVHRVIQCSTPSYAMYTVSYNVHCVIQCTLCYAMYTVLCNVRQVMQCTPSYAMYTVSYNVHRVIQCSTPCHTM